jgi:hypothetical protein
MSQGDFRKITLSQTFAMDGYTSQINVLRAKHISVHCEGAVLDAAQTGRFFYVAEMSSLELHNCTLQNGADFGPHTPTISPSWVEAYENYVSQSKQFDIAFCLTFWLTLVLYREAQFQLEKQR